MNYKNVISFIIGAAFGFGGGFIFFKNFFNKKASEEIKEMREYSQECRKYAKEMKKYAEEMYELATGNDAPSEDLLYEEITNFLLNEDKKNGRKKDSEIKSIEESYDSMQDAIKVKEIEEESYMDSLHDYTKYSKDPSAYEHPNDEPGIATIELITALEYDNSRPTNEKIILNYFSEDDILCYDEDETIIENPEELIGSEALHAFGSPDYEDPNEIFVRNNKRSEDYQIILYEEYYNHM